MPSSTARSSAERNLRWTPWLVSATGSEPRVPQKRTRTALLPPESQCGARRQRRKRGAHVRKHAEQQREAADLEDLAYHGLHAGDDDLAALPLRTLRRQHERSQARARDVGEIGKIEHHAH